MVFYHIPEDYSVDNYSIWCIRKIFYLHLSIPRVQANTVQHTYLIVVSITEIIEYYKNGYLSATVGTRRGQITIFIIFYQYLQFIKLLSIILQKFPKFPHSIFQNFNTRQINHSEMIRLLPVKSTTMHDQKFLLT